MSKIGVEEINKIMDAYENDVTVDWNGLDVTIHKTIPVRKMLQFVADTVSSSFAKETGEYQPELKDFAIRCNIIAFYTDVDLQTDTEEGVEAAYNILYGTDIVRTATEYINDEQLSVTLEAIDDKVKHLARSNIEALNKNMTDLLTSVETITKKIEEIFGGVDNDTITVLAKAMANGAFDERNLIKAVKAEAIESLANRGE